MREFSPYDLMQAAVDIVNDSPHPTNKVAATLAGPQETLARTNHYIGVSQERIGSSSGSVHAETACALAAQNPTDGAALFVTDLPCPNCLKNMAEAGIKKIYIDHKAFNKDWAQRRGDHFTNMSMQICEKAGISVYKINRKEKIITPIFEAPENYVPVVENPVVRLQSGETLPFKKGEAYATIMAENSLGETFLLAASPHPAIGYTSDTLDTPEDKYSFVLQPTTRLLMYAARHGLQLQTKTLFSSRTPTSRELVNLVGAGITTLTIGDRTQCRDEHGIQALKQLEDAEILEVLEPELNIQ